MRARWMTFGLLCLLAPAAAAQGYYDLYSKAQLEADAARYREQVLAEYRETILPKLTAAEKAALADVRIEFPVVGKAGDLFEFYSDAKTVHLPALSLRFCSDLCVANSWLNAHGYDATTVRDYVGFLFHHARVSPTAPWPPLFKALGVPPNARDEAAVAARASRDFGNTVVFLLAHELGHIVKAHHSKVVDLPQRRVHEIEADQFAMSVMRRLPQIPLGIEQWFDWERIRYEAETKFPTDAQWQKHLASLTHPVTKERLEALAAEIEKAPEDFVGARLQQNPALWTMRAKMFAQSFRLAAPFSGNAIVRAAEYSRIRDLRLSALKPRPAAFTVPGATPGAADVDFEGFYRARRTFPDGRQGTDFDLLLMRSGDEVTGTYSAANIRGSIEGRVKGKAMHFQWTEGNVKGRGHLESTGESFTGTWGRAESEEGSGAWQGTLRKAQ